jgi:Flp pilus assembly protein TadD
MGEVLIREKRTGLVSAAEAKPPQFTPPSTDTATVTENYAQRHYRRAQEYMKKGNWAQAVQELRDAIKIEANKSEYHALLGVAYLQQKLPGMATVYIRQALKLNPRDPLASKYAAKLGIQPTAENSAKQNGKQPNSQQGSKPPKSGGLFGFFRSKK